MEFLSCGYDYTTLTVNVVFFFVGFIFSKYILIKKKKKSFLIGDEPKDFMASMRFGKNIVNFSHIIH